MSIAKYLAPGFSAFLCGCAMLAGLDDDQGDLDSRKPTPEGSLDPEPTGPKPPGTPGGDGAELVTPAAGVVAMAVDDTTIFYATPDELLSVAIEPGSTPRLLLEQTIAHARVGDYEKGWGVHRLDLLGVAVNRDRVFVVDRTWARVFACPKAGCTTTTGGTVHMWGAPNGQIAVDDALVVWGESRGVGISLQPTMAGELDAKFEPEDDDEPRRIVSTVVDGKSAGVWLTDKAILYGDQPKMRKPMVSAPAVSDFAMKDGKAYGINGASVLEIDTKTGAKTIYAAVPGVVTKRIVADANGIFVLGERADRQMELYRVTKDRADVLAELGRVRAIALGKTHVFAADGDAIVRILR